MNYEILEIKRGDDVTLNITATTKEIVDGEEVSTPVDLTGLTVRLTAKRKFEQDDDDAAISLDITDHTDPENGKTSAILTSGLTDVEPGDYYADFQVEQPGISSSKTFIIRILPDVTRRTE